MTKSRHPFFALFPDAGAKFEILIIQGSLNLIFLVLLTWFWWQKQKENHHEHDDSDVPMTDKVLRLLSLCAVIWLADGLLIKVMIL